MFKHIGFTSSDIHSVQPKRGSFTFLHFIQHFFFHSLFSFLELSVIVRLCCLSILCLQFLSFYHTLSIDYKLQHKQVTYSILIFVSLIHIEFHIGFKGFQIKSPGHMMSFSFIKLCSVQQ